METANGLMWRIKVLEAAAGPSVLTVWRQIVRDLGLPFVPALV